MMKPITKANRRAGPSGYGGLVSGIEELLAAARHATARATNTFTTATYWEVGRRIVDFEQGGKKRAEYGEALLRRLAADLKTRHGRGFSHQNLQRFREFYLAHTPEWIRSTLSGKSSGPVLAGPEHYLVNTVQALKPF